LKVIFWISGTIGLELLDQIPKLERILVPVSGGGFVCGVAVAVKSVNPFIEVIGVCAEGGNLTSFN
jgi:threonine dehydratase